MLDFCIHCNRVVSINTNWRIEKTAVSNFSDFSFVCIIIKFSSEGVEIISEILTILYSILKLYCRKNALPYRWLIASPFVKKSIMDFCANLHKISLSPNHLIDLITWGSF